MAIQDQIPKSRVTLTYRTDVNGDPVDEELPLRFLVMGDFSQGKNKEEFDERKIQNVGPTSLPHVMRKMNLSCKVDVSKIDSEGTEEVEIPIDNMKAFQPDEFAKHVPSIRALMACRTLIEELQASVVNQRPFRKEFQEIFKNKDSRKALAAYLQETIGDHLKFSESEPGNGDGDGDDAKAEDGEAAAE